MDIQRIWKILNRHGNEWISFSFTVSLIFSFFIIIYFLWLYIEFTFSRFHFRMITSLLVIVILFLIPLYREYENQNKFYI